MPLNLPLDVVKALQDLALAHATMRCIQLPIGCAGPATQFRDDLSRTEYGISGLCQTCQDKVFGTDDE